MFGAWIRRLVLVLGCCASQPSIAQQTAVEPLVPIRAEVLVNTLTVPKTAAASSAVAAKPAPAVPVRALINWPPPLYVLQSAVIIGPDFLGVQPDEIKELRIYKGQDAPWAWRHLTTYGIVDIFLNERKKVKSRTFAEIGKQLGVSGSVSYTVNGMPVDDPTLRVALDAIGEIKIMRGTSAAAATTVAVLIKSPKPSPPHPPGTIYIRGTAAL